VLDHAHFYEADVGEQRGQIGVEGDGFGKAFEGDPDEEQRGEEGLGGAGAAVALPGENAGAPEQAEVERGAGQAERERLVEVGVVGVGDGPALVEGDGFDAGGGPEGLIAMAENGVLGEVSERPIMKALVTAVRPRLPKIRMAAGTARARPARRVRPRVWTARRARAKRMAKTAIIATQRNVLTRERVRKRRTKAQRVAGASQTDQRGLRSSRVSAQRMQATRFMAW